MPARKPIAALGFLILASHAAAVEIELEIVDGKGVPVSGLVAADLRLEMGRGEAGLDALRYVEGLSETKLGIGAEMPATDYANVERAVGALIDMLPPGLEVSLGGTPFTSDKGKLREYLSLGFELGRRSPGAGLTRVWDFGQGYLIQGRPVLDKYTLLASQLAAIPGQKRVVLYRQSLELRQDGIDTREMGIRTGQLRQNDYDMLRNDEAIDKLGTVATLARVRFYTTNASVSMADMNDQGLNSIARHTGGKALLGVGNPADILHAALADLPAYYVASLQPAFQGGGARWNLKASIERKGVNVNPPRGYLIDAPGLANLGAPPENLLEKQAADAKLAIRSEQWVFRGPAGGPIVLVSAGAPVSALGSSPAGKGVAVELELAAGARAGDAWTTGAQRSSRQIFDKKAFTGAQKQGEVWVDVTASGEFPGPGMHPWKTVLKDQAGGAFGVRETAAAVHDLARPMATSDVLLTRRAVPIKPDTPAEPWGDLLDFGASRLVPESTREFRIGEPVLFTYRLYNPPQEMLANPPPVQLALFHGDSQLESFDGQGESRVIAALNEIQYVGSIETKGLAPGDYAILSAVPGREDERQPYVEGVFRLVKK